MVNSIDSSAITWADAPLGEMLVATSWHHEVERVVRIPYASDFILSLAELDPDHSRRPDVCGLSPHGFAARFRQIASRLLRGSSWCVAPSCGSWTS